MLLRVRVILPDRPGSLGQVARTLGVAGADIMQVLVLERLAGQAVDDFSVVWPSGSRVDRLLAGLNAIPGVQVAGIWAVTGAPVSGVPDMELLAQIAADPDDGLATLVDAVPGLIAADWAGVVAVPAEWADPASQATATMVCASGQAPDRLVPDVVPLRPRALEEPDGTRYAVAPFGRAGLVLLTARSQATELPAAAFHRSEVDRLAQLVRAASAVLGERLANSPASV